MLRISRQTLCGFSLCPSVRLRPAIAEVAGDQRAFSPSRKLCGHQEAAYTWSAGHGSVNLDEPVPAYASDSIGTVAPIVVESVLAVDVHFGPADCVVDPLDMVFGRPTQSWSANAILVEGDVSKSLTKLRHIHTVFIDGYRLEGRSLRRESGLSGMPN